MNSLAIDAEKLAELDEDTRRAWGTYRERIREKTGLEYDTTEAEAWTDLQTRLRAVERRRRRLTADPA